MSKRPQFYKLFPSITANNDQDAQVLVYYNDFDHEDTNDTPHVVVIEAYEEQEIADETEYRNRLEFIRFASMETATDFIENFSEAQAESWVTRHFLEA